MDWGGNDLERRVFNYLFPPAENIQGVQTSIARRVRQQLNRDAEFLAESVEGGYIQARGYEANAQEDVAQRGAEGNAQEDVAQRGGALANIAQVRGQPAAGGAGDNRDINQNVMVGNIINLAQLFQRMDQSTLIWCRLWLILLLGSVYRELSNEQKQTMEGYRATFYNDILADNSVHRRAFVILKLILEHHRYNLPNFVIREFAKVALDLIAFDNNGEFHYAPRTGQGLLGLFESLVNISLWPLYSIFSMFKTLFPSIARKFSRPPDRRYQNGHCLQR